MKKFLITTKNNLSVNHGSITLFFSEFYSEIAHDVFDLKEKEEVRRASVKEIIQER
jgi:hypothetical protein